ncbi:Putative white-brown complex-like protein 30, partial [Frankliniella fusca]
ECMDGENSEDLLQGDNASQLDNSYMDAMVNSHLIQCSGRVSDQLASDCGLFLHKQQDLSQISIDDGDALNCSVEKNVDKHLNAVGNNLNDTDVSENGNESDVNFNTSDYLQEQLFSVLLNQDSKSTDCNKDMTVDIHCNGNDILVEDETTTDCGELLFTSSSTPCKQDCPSGSFTNLMRLVELTSQIPPIPFQDSCGNISSDSDSDESNDSESDNQEDTLSSEDEVDEWVETHVYRDYLGNDDSFCQIVCGPEDQGVNISATSEDFTCLQGLPDVVSKSCLLNYTKLHSKSDKSVNESILDIMDLFLKNKLSKAALSRTLKVMISFLEEDHNLPTSTKKILDYIVSLAPPVPAKVHYFCESCSFYHGETITGQCEICRIETKFQHFYIFDMATLIKFFFECRNLAAIIDTEVEKRKNSDPNVLKDVKDGSAYKSINFNRGKYDITIILNSDGVRIRKGSKKELWLVMFTIAELPIHLQKSFLSVAGVWYNTKKPDMRTFLKPFVQSMESLDHTGVKWIHPNSSEAHCSCVRMLMAVLDAPARAMVQNTMQFNSRYGCNMCEIKCQKSKPLPDVHRRPRVYNYVHNITLRTKERMLEQAIKACASNVDNVRGVKGPSILSSIPSVDISKCIVPEYMHSVLIGSVKQLVTIWTEENGNWSIKGKISEVDNFLNTYKHPDFVHRKSRQLKSLSYWKASDFYYFLLFEALPCLHGILLHRYFQHFLLLVKAIFTLLKSEITKSDMTESDLLLKLFVADFKNLYGDRAQTHNVHQLLHLALCVELYGPLFCFSAFPFEDLNGVIAKATHGTNYVDTEIVNNIVMCEGIEMLRNIVRGHHGVTEHSPSFCQGELLGKEVAKTVLSSEDLNILDDPNAVIYSRARIGYDVYTSQIHKSLSSANFYISWKSTNATNYGAIKYFAESQGNKFLVVDLFSVDQTRLFYHERSLKCIEHFVPVKSSTSSVALRFSDVSSSIIKVGKIKKFVYLRPNLYRFVM